MFKIISEYLLAAIFRAKSVCFFWITNKNIVVSICVFLRINLYIEVSISIWSFSKRPLTEYIRFQETERKLQTESLYLGRNNGLTRAMWMHLEAEQSTIKMFINCTPICKPVSVEFRIHIAIFYCFSTQCFFLHSINTYCFSTSRPTLNRKWAVDFWKRLITFLRTSPSSDSIS